MAAAPEEILPDPTPTFLFFFPNFLGVLLAFLLEYSNDEMRLAKILSAAAHPYSLLGLGMFVTANVASFLGGSVVLARLQYGVKLPNLYADKKENKNAVQFNCVQRGHQNFLENFPQTILSCLFTAMVAERPRVAGFLLGLSSLCRVFYGVGYRWNNIRNRLPPFLVAQFANTVGIGYAALIGLTAFGIDVMKKNE